MTLIYFHSKRYLLFLSQNSDTSLKYGIRVFNDDLALTANAVPFTR